MLSWLTMVQERRRAGLSRQTIVQTALGLLDQVGLEGLTVRRLAAELGVQSPALYWHLRGKQELLDGMADAIIMAAGMGPPRPGESWQAWLPVGPVPTAARCWPTATAPASSPTPA